MYKSYNEINNSQTKKCCIFRYFVLDFLGLSALYDCTCFPPLRTAVFGTHIVTEKKTSTFTFKIYTKIYYIYFKN